MRTTDNLIAMSPATTKGSWSTGSRPTLINAYEYLCIDLKRKETNRCHGIFFNKSLVGKHARRLDGY